MNGTTLYTPTSSLGRFRADDYFKLPEWTQFELLRGWLVPLNEPTADPTVKSEDAYRATMAVADQWIEGVQSHRCVAGLPAITRRQLVIEIKSPGRRPARMRRLRRYAQLGVEEYWFIDPIERFMLFYVLNAGQYVVHTGIDNRYQSPRLLGVAIDLASFWKEVAERLPAV